MAKFTKSFSGVVAGDIYPTDFEKGEECPAELVEAAKEAGALPGGAKAPKSSPKQSVLGIGDGAEKDGSEKEGEGEGAGAGDGEKD